MLATMGTESLFKAPLETLLAQGRDRGYVTVSEIVEATSNEGEQADGLDEFFARLEEEGIDVIEDDDDPSESEDFDGANGHRTAAAIARHKTTDDMLNTIKTDDIVHLYFRDVRPIPLLNREEEVELAKQIQQGDRAKRRLEKGDVPMEDRAPLDEAVRLGDQALEHLVEANFRLVISIAKRYVGHGVPLLDLIQEGNLGLIRAAEKFDYRRGNKFSTYATWWIRQAVRRATADQGRTIRLPVHMRDRITKLNRLSNHLEKERGHEPTVDELAAETTLSPEQVELAMRAIRDPLSLEQPVGDDDGELGDLIESLDAPDPVAEVDRELLHEEIRGLMSALTPREARVLALRYGLADGRERSLKEVGDQFGLTRERIRQIENEALRKLRYPPRSRHLRAYLN